MTRPNAACAFALGLGLLCSSRSAAFAQEKTIALDPLGDGLALSLGIGAALASELLIDGRAEPLERPDMSSIPALDALACFPYDDGLDAASKAAEAATILWPALFAFVGERDELLPAAAVCAESLAWTYAVKECLKGIFPRVRPYAYHDGALSDELLEEARESFPSGHAALAFSAAASFATLALSTAPDDPATPWLVAGGFAMATGASALRVASGNHFITDVAAGAALGSAIGWATAALHLRAKESQRGAAEGTVVAMIASGPSALLRIRLR